MLNFGFKHKRRGIRSLIKYSNDYTNIGTGGSQYNAILYSSQYMSTLFTVTFDTTNIKQLTYYFVGTGFQVVDVSAVNTYVVSTRVNNIMLFDRLLTSTEITALTNNQSLWDKNTAPSFLKEWYPCSENNGLLLHDMLSTKTYTIPTNSWDTLYVNHNVGIQAILYEKDVNGTLTVFKPYNQSNINTTKDYIDTQWIPKNTEDWTIELEQEFNSNDSYNLSGLDTLTPNEQRFFFGEINLNRPYIRLGASTWTGTTQTSGWKKLTVKYTSSTSTIEFYLNDILLTTISATYINSLKTFHIGWINVLTGAYTNYRNIKIYNKVI